MPKPGKPFSPTPDFDNNRPVALPDLLAGLMNNASLGAVSSREEIPTLTPEVMSPDEPMPPATPVNTSMPEFLESLRTLLHSYDDTTQVLSPDLPVEAVQDFAHGTNELLNYLLNEVVGAAAPAVAPHAPDAAHDFAEATNELLNYLLCQVAEPTVNENTVYTPEAMADFEVGTQDLLQQLLAMSDQEEPGAAEPVLASAGVAEPSAAEPLPVEREEVPVEMLGELLSRPVPEEPGVSELPAVDESVGHDLLSGLLANLGGGGAATARAVTHHNLGEAPRAYIDESDEAEGERQAGAFELLLDAIDAELPPPPALPGGMGVSPDALALQAGERFIAFELADQHYAFPFESVTETDRVPRWTHVPGMAAHLRGVLNLRGEIIPLVDLRALFGLGAATAEGRMIILRSSSAKVVFAAVVDRLVGLVSIKANEIEAQPGQSVLRGVAAAAGRLIGLLDPERVIAAASGDQALPRQAIVLNHFEERTEYV